MQMVLPVSGQIHPPNHRATTIPTHVAPTAIINDFFESRIVDSIPCPVPRIGQPLPYPIHRVTFIKTGMDKAINAAYGVNDTNLKSPVTKIKMTSEWCPPMLLCINLTTSIPSISRRRGQLLIHDTFLSRHSRLRSRRCHLGPHAPAPCGPHCSILAPMSRFKSCPRCCSLSRAVM